MSLGKKDISKNISTKAHISSSLSLSILDSFINLIKTNSKVKIVKLSRFGSFDYKLSPKRMGRNPKTKENFVIVERSRLTFKISNKVKSFLN
jgi:integration host factor subunit alpha